MQARDSIPLGTSHSAFRTPHSALRWVPFALLSALILLFSTDWFSGDRVYSAIQEHLIGRELAEDNFINRWHLFIRKAGHILAFLLLGLSLFPLKKRSEGRFRCALVCCAAVAAASELVQLLSPHRDAALRDVGVDLGAAFLGLRLLFSPPAFLGRAALPPREPAQPAKPAASTTAARSAGSH